MFAIHQAGLSDLNAIMELAASVPEAPHWERNAYETYLAHPDRCIFIADQHETIIGFIAGTAVHDFCELESIVVSEDTRGIGAGKALLATLIEWARAKSVSRAQLEVRAGNASAIRFYTRAGFHAEGFRRNYYRRPDEDAVLMSLPLTSGSTSGG